MLIQLQGGNNLADLTFETVWVEKLEMFKAKHETVHLCLMHSALDFLILLMCSGFSIKIGDVIAC